MEQIFRGLRAASSSTGRVTAPAGTEKEVGPARARTSLFSKMRGKEESGSPRAQETIRFMSAISTRMWTTRCWCPSCRRSSPPSTRRRWSSIQWLRCLRVMASCGSLSKSRLRLPSQSCRANTFWHDQLNWTTPRSEERPASKTDLRSLRQPASKQTINHRFSSTRRNRISTEDNSPCRHTEQMATTSRCRRLHRHPLTTTATRCLTEDSLPTGQCRPTVCKAHPLTDSSSSLGTRTPCRLTEPSSRGWEDLPPPCRATTSQADSKLPLRTTTPADAPLRHGPAAWRRKVIAKLNPALTSECRWNVSRHHQHSEDKPRLTEQSDLKSTSSRSRVSDVPTNPRGRQSEARHGHVWQAVWVAEAAARGQARTGKCA